MSMIFFNIIGALMLAVGLVAGIAAGGLTSLFSRKEDLQVAVGVMVAFPVMVIWDFIYRWRHNRDWGWLRYILPTTGGMFMLLPIWVWFGAIPFGGTVVMVIRKQLGMQ